MVETTQNNKFKSAAIYGVCIKLQPPVAVMQSVQWLELRRGENENQYKIRCVSVRLPYPPLKFQTDQKLTKIQNWTEAQKQYVWSKLGLNPSIAL